MKKFLSVTLSLLLAASVPLSALAETYDLAQGSITVEAKADGNQYVSQAGGVQQEQQTTETVINQYDFYHEYHHHPGGEEPDRPGHHLGCEHRCERHW